MEAPEQITPGPLADYLEVMTKAVFQSGIKWEVVQAKWPAFREAFAGFDPGVLAAFSPDDLDRLTANPSIIRNRRKIEATVANAAVWLAVEREFGSARRYLDQLPSFVERVRDLRARFHHVGGFGAYYFLYVIGEPVPPHDTVRDILTAPEAQPRRRRPAPRSA